MSDTYSVSWPNTVSSDSRVRPLPTLSDTCELALCESQKLILRPGVFYLFRVFEDCADCKRIAVEGALSDPIHEEEGLG